MPHSWPFDDSKRPATTALPIQLQSRACRCTGPRAAGDGPALIEVERTAQSDVDAAADAAFDQVRRARLVDVDAGDELGRNILQRDAAAGSGEGLAAVEV
jgi:hypothetical protein